VHHLVAAGREHDPGFAPTTSSNLAEIGVGGPSREAVVETFIRELGPMAEGGALLIFDDFHHVDDAPDARYIARELVAKAPERLTIAFASRRQPTIPLGRLRAVGEVAEVGTDDLRFDADETARLFTETYGRVMDADVLHDLAVRTEGWIASLQLVQAALRNRTPAEIRQFVREMTGADSDLYDYLAEEVVGDLPSDLQHFLMTTALLQIVTPAMAEVVSDAPEDEVARLTVDAERLTLLSRVSGGPRTHLRYHPLVREFLEARLRASAGDAVVDDLHRRAGAAAAATDWRVAAHHYREAGDTETMLGIINDSIPTIMGNAQYALAAAFLSDGNVDADVSPGALLIRGRIEYQDGDFKAAGLSAQAVIDSVEANPIQRDYALLNLLAVSFNSGNGELALDLAGRLAGTTSDADLMAIAQASSALLSLQTAAELESLVRKLRSMARQQRGTRSHHFGVSMYNLAGISVQLDHLEAAATEVEEAVGAFAETSSRLELHAALVLRLSVELRLGRHEEASNSLKLLLRHERSIENDALIEAADAFHSWGSRETALQLMDRVSDPSTQSAADRRLFAVVGARIALRDGRADDALSAIDGYPPGIATAVGLDSARDILRAQVQARVDGSSASDALEEARERAALAGLTASRRLAELLIGLERGGESASLALTVGGADHPWHITYAADVVVRSLHVLSMPALEVVRDSARMHPERWRRELRAALDATVPQSLPAAELLDEIGDRTDVARLRGFAKSLKRRANAATLGRGLARRLAERVYVEDQGRMSVVVGNRDVVGSAVRRKVLALLAFLLTRPSASATRDQVLDALWPELDPEVAVNSLNQTIYFLRRVFEEDYSEDTSPGYVHHDGDVIWLDSELVGSRSIDCRTFIRHLGPDPAPTEVQVLATTYRGRFALDFEYEDWAGMYRDTLHASYLEVMERAVRADFEAGHYDRAISLARRTLEVDPEAEQVEVALLRLYRATGAHAAAAEQYAHYSTYLREELGLDPAPLESL
jgi:DNA-binding SARP family transcriptional activator